MRHERLKKHWATTVLATIITLITAPSFAQQAPVTAQGQCPLQISVGERTYQRTEVFARLDQIANGARPSGSMADNGFGGKFYTARATAKWVSQPVNGSDVAIPSNLLGEGNRVKIGQRVYGIREDTFTGRMLVAYRNSSGTTSTSEAWHCGWVDTRDLTRAKAITFTELVEKIDDIGKYGAVKRPLSVKVIAKTDLRSASKGDALGAPIFDEPGGKPIGGLRIFDVHNAFDAEKFGDKTYLLVGARNNANVPVIGWVSAADLIFWSSSMSVYYHPEAPDVRFFRDRDAAIAAVTAGVNEGLVGQKPEDYLDPEDRVLPRFPIIDESLKHKRRFYRVAFPGITDDFGTPQEVREGVIGIGKVNDEIRRVRQVDLAFLIDGTASMQKYYPLVAQAVEAFADRRAENDRPEAIRYRFAAFSYGDYVGGGTSRVQYDSISEFDTESSFRGTAQDLFYVDKEPFTSDANGDKPEAVGRAILEALNEPFIDDGRIKAIVLVGDHGPRVFNETFTQLTSEGPITLTEPVSVGDVVDKLKEKRTLLFGVGVQGERLPAQNRNFVDFVNAVTFGDTNLVTDEASTALLTYDPLADGPEDEEFVVDKIIEALNSVETVLEERIENLVRQIRVESGTLRPTKIETTVSSVEEFDDLPLVYLRRRIDEILEEQLDIDDLRAAYNNAPVVETGWVSETGVNDDAQIEFWVAMDFDELHKLVKASEDLCDSFVRSTDAEDFIDSLWRKLAGAASADTEMMAGASLAELLELRFAIPASHFSDVLQLPLEDLKAWYRSEAKVIRKVVMDPSSSKREETYEPLDSGQFLLSICKSGTWLRAVRGSRKPGYLERVESRSSDIVLFSEQDVTDAYQWSWGTSGGAELFWIPVWMLP